MTCVKFGTVEEANDVMELTFMQMLRFHPNVTIAEILHSYFLVSKGKLECKMFRLLDFAQMNEFYKAYKEFGGVKLARKNREGKLYLDTYTRVLESKDEFYPKELKKAKEIVSSGKLYHSTCSVGMFDWLKENGKISYTKAEANEWLVKGEKRYKASISHQKITKQRELIALINPEELGKSGGVVRWAKILMLNEYLKK